MPLRRGSGDISVGTPSPTWFASYSDLVTQLLVFFVMMFALASAKSQSQVEQIEKRVRAYAKANEIEDYIRTVIEANGLTISLSDRLMFRSGEAVLVSEEARRHIAGIADILKEYPNYVAIEGHTDNRPVRNNPQFPTNWELSTARATNLTRFLIENGFPTNRVSSAGYGEFHPIEPNTTEEGMARNRRVDMVVGLLTIQQQKANREERGLEGKEFKQVPEEVLNQ